MEITGKTSVYCIIGYPVEHSFSPPMQNAAFRSTGIDAVYVPFQVKRGDLHTAINSFRALGIRGANVTVPHKSDVIPLLDEVDGEAAFIGAVNTIVNKDGHLIGYNTDGRGFMESLREAGIVVKGKKVLILGAGGASRAVSFYVARAGGRVFIHNRTKSRAISLGEDLMKENLSVEIVDSQGDVIDPEIVINTTSLGLSSNDPLPIPPHLLRPGQTICDLIYWDTPLIKEAKNKGLRTLNGLGMLLWQGVLAFKLWTGMEPPVDLMREKLIEMTEKV